MATTIVGSRHRKDQLVTARLDNANGGRRLRPPRPPVTVPMLAALNATLKINEPFDACVWAMVACAFWGMMRFGEVAVKLQAQFNGAKHLKQGDVTTSMDERGRPYARLDLLQQRWLSQARHSMFSCFRRPCLPARGPPKSCDSCSRCSRQSAVLTEGFRQRTSDLW